MSNNENQDRQVDTIQIEFNGEVTQYPINSELVKPNLVLAILEEAMENEEDSTIQSIIYDAIVELNEYYSQI